MPLYDYKCHECQNQFESIEKVDTLMVNCTQCDCMANRITTTPPSWKFNDMHKNMWCGDSAEALKKFKKRK